MLRGRAAAARRVPNKPGNGGYRGAMSRAEQELKKNYEQKDQNRIQINDFLLNFFQNRMKIVKNRTRLKRKAAKNRPGNIDDDDDDDDEIELHWVDENFDGTKVF